MQAQKLEAASTDSHIYTNWADEKFYLAFKVSGLSNTLTRISRNYISYQFRRAWGEDVCQVLVQPIYADNTLGPVLHLALKPSGSSSLERKLDPKRYADPWVPSKGRACNIPLRSHRRVEIGAARSPFRGKRSAIDKTCRSCCGLISCNTRGHR